MTGNIIIEPECFCCKYAQEWPRCSAFPSGIPEEIRLGEQAHRQPYEGDNGVQFEPVEGERAE